MIHDKTKPCAMRRMLDTALRECRRMRANTIYLLCMVVFPLGVTLLFTSLMGEGQPQNMPVGVCDLDNTATTRHIVRLLDSFQSTKVIARYESVDEARHAMQRGEIYGFVYFPKNTTSQLLASRQPKVSFYYSNTSLTAGSLVYKDMKTAMTLASAGAGRQVLAAKGMDDSHIMAFLQPVTLDTHPIGNPWLNYNIYLSTMLVPACLMLFIFLTTSYSLGQEMKMSTGRELLSTAWGNIWVALAGKLLPQTLIFTGVMAAYMYYVFGILGFPHPGGVLPTALLGLLGVLSAQGLGVLVFAIIPSLRMSMSICSLWGVLGFSLVGTAFPVMSMDKPLQVLANLFPIRHFFEIYNTCIFGGFPLSYASLHLTALVTFSLLPIVCAPLIRRSMYTYIYMP